MILQLGLKAGGTYTAPTGINC